MGYKTAGGESPKGLVVLGGLGAGVDVPIQQRVLRLETRLTMPAFDTPRSFGSIIGRVGLSL